MTDLTPAVLPRPGCDVVYRRRDSRDGAWVVFLHGAGADGHMFDGNLGAVPSDWGIAVWDARGHGASTLSGPFRYVDMLADLEALVAELRTSRLVLIGQSMGGNLAQTYADRHDDELAGLVVVDATDNHGRLNWLDLLALRSSGLILRLYPWTLLVRQSADACGTQAHTRSYMRACLKRMGKARFVEVMGFWRDALVPGSPRRGSTPTLLVLGDQDRSGDIARALPAWAGAAAETKLVTLRNAAHNSNQDQPRAFNAAVADWCSTLGGSALSNERRPS